MAGSKDPMLVNLGAFLRSARKAQGWTQEQLAFECGLHTTYVAAVERGVYNVTMKTLRKLTVALNVSLTDAMSAVEAAAPKAKRAKKP